MTGNDFDKTKRMGTQGDEPTRIVFRDTYTNKPTEILNDPGGTVIGVAGVQRGGGAVGAQAAGGQGETVFVKSVPGAEQKYDPVVGWVVVTDGPGKGHFRPVFYGQNAIGRGVDQRVSLDFGDERISRETHAFIIYDDAQRKFFVRDNGKSNLVRHQGNIVMMPSELKDRDTLVVGDTTLLFIALCGSDFDWLADNEPTNS